MFKGKKIVSIITALITLLHVGAPLVLAEEFVVTGNGSGSNNEVVIQSESTTSIEQTNTGSVNNDVETSTNTGGNEIEDSNGLSSITTGDATSSVDVETSVNSSVINNECCASDSLTLEISQNGSSSTNSIDITSTRDTNVSITQNVNVTNEVKGSVNTGENKIKDNVGNAKVNTGDIFVNSKIKNGPINVENISGGNGEQSLFASVSNNGSGSQNLISALISDLANINTRNNANISNHTVWDLNTGRNEIDGNVGDASIKTGGIFLNLFVENGPINSGVVDWGCCHKDNPDDPDDPGVPQTPHTGGSNGGTSGGGSSFSEILGTGGPAVLGLSNTSAILNSPVTFWLGLMFIVIGVATFGNSRPQTKLRLNAKKERFSE